jgi:nucleoside-diphosphate-sugar epimerase
VARALIVGCGCHGRELAGRLMARGWRVRGTSRERSRLAEIECAGFEAASADPDRPGTVLDLCADVTTVVWLLGSASGQADAISAVHGPRLERLLEKLVDSPVRGFAYEGDGTAGDAQLESGRRIVESAGARWRIPVAVLTGSRDEPGWAEQSADQIAGLLAGG